MNETDDNTPKESAVTNHSAIPAVESAIAVIDFEREARIIRDVLLSDQINVNIKDFFRFYLADLTLSTRIVRMDDALTDMPHLDPELLPVLYPVMRRRDGGGYGVTALIHAALNGFCGTNDNREADAIYKILNPTRARS